MKLKSKEQWKKELTEEQYRVLVEKGTEPSFTGKYVNNKDDGTYVCAACGHPLFSSESKYDSGSGWPSFHSVIDKKNVDMELDKSLGMIRSEIHCSNCGGHLGHLFNDGPTPTGERFCINSASLDFKDEDANETP